MIKFVWPGPDILTVYHKVLETFCYATFKTLNDILNCKSAIVDQHCKYFGTQQIFYAMKPSTNHRISTLTYSQIFQ